jgi:16S rRNA (uracil1498-N3)-methyltransferase
MPHNRYYLDTPFQEDQTVVVADEEFHHLTRVLRAKIGERVELVNGRWQLAQAKLVEMTKHEATLVLTQVTTAVRQKPPVILALGLTRMNHLEWTIEKGTELNAAAFWLFPGLLSEKKELKPTQTTRLNHLAIAAMKQCGRLDLPTIETKPPLLQWKPLQGTLLFGDPQGPYPWELELRSPLPEPIVIFIGPEGGFDHRETEYFHKSLSAIGLRLSPNILRAETASLTALSLIQQLIY